VEEIQACSNEVDSLSPRKITVKESEKKSDFLKIFSPEQAANFNQTWYTSPFVTGNSSFFE
jgi:hypothetical protein